MTFGEVYHAALAADPLACYAAALALAFVAWNIVARRGGASSGSIIRIFGSCATVATLFKILWWLVAMIFSLSHPPAVPSGTDGVLVLGTVVAGLYVLVEDIRATLVDDQSTEAASLGWVALKRLRGLSQVKWLIEKRNASQVGQAATETPDAAKVRETIDKERDGSKTPITPDV